MKKEFRNMFDLNKYYTNLNLNEKISLLGLISLMLLFVSVSLHLSFNFYGSLNGNLTSSLIFLITIFSTILYFYFLYKVVKTRNNSLIKRIILITYIFLAIILFLFKNISFSMTFS